MRKFLSLMFALVVIFSIACGGGKETKSSEDEGEDDEEQVTETTATAATAAPAAAPVASPDAATLTGLVKFEGAVPAMPTLAMGADPYCQSQHQGAVKDDEVLVGPGGELANVIVWVKNAPPAPPATTPAVLDQQGCQYHPHVLALQAGQPLQIKNSDNTLHNVHAQPEVNAQFNEGQPLQGMVATKKFDKVELKPFRVKCDVHGWMKAYMVVLPHPWHGVSQMNGTFTIANLPPGNYTLVAWHEKYGQQEQQVTVGPKEQKQVNFTFKG